MHFWQKRRVIHRLDDLAGLAAGARGGSPGPMRFYRLFGDGFRVWAHAFGNRPVPEQHFAEWLFTVIPQSAGNRLLEWIAYVSESGPQQPARPLSEERHRSGASPLRDKLGHYWRRQLI